MTKGKKAPAPAQQALNADRPVVEPWSTRYLEYARANGTPNPAVMLRRDENRFPAGKMAGFILWIGARWAEWRTVNKLSRDEPLATVHHAEFDSWLTKWVDQKTAVIVQPLPATIVRPR